MSTDGIDLGELSNVLADVQAKQKEIARIQGERNKLLGDELGMMREMLNDREQNLLSAEKQLMKLKESGDLLSMTTDKFSEEYAEILNTIGLMGSEFGKTGEELQKAFLEGKLSIDEVISSVQKMQGRISDAERTMSDLGRAGGKFANSLGLASKFSETTAGGVIEMVSKMKDATKAGFSLSKQFNAVFGSSINILNILGTVVDIVGKFVIQTDNVAKNFQKATGFTGNFRDNIQSVSAELAATGISAEDVGKNFQTIAENFSGFNKNATVTNNELLRSVSLLNNLGVSSAESAKNINFLTRSMKMSTDQAIEVNEQIATMGDEMGVTAAKMASDFRAVSGELSVYGPRMMGVFQELAATAKATGLEVSSLVALGQKFDTFSDAASNAGKLNAVLGTNISAMEMMNMTEAERVRLLREQIQNSVQDFDNLDKYTQKFIAQSLGLKDVAEARALVNMSEQEYLDNLSAQEASAKTQEEMLDMSQKLVPVLDQLKMSFMKFALSLSPIITLLSGFLDLLAGVADFALFLADNIYYLIGGFIAYEIITIAVNIATNGFAVSQMFMQSGIAKTIGFLYSKITALVTYKSTAEGATLFTKLLGLVFKTLYGRVFIVVAILFGLYKLLNKKSSPKFYLLFGVMALGVIALAIALKFVKGQAMVAAIVLALLAASVALIFYGIEAVVTSLKELVLVLAANITMLPMMASGLYLIAGGLLAIGAAGLMSIAGIVAATGALAAMILVMKAGGMDIGDVSQAAADVVTMGASIEKLAAGMSQIKSLASEISQIGGEGFLAVKSDGTATSMVMGSGGVMQNFVDGKMTVDVKIPEISMPEITVNVYVDKKGNVDVIKTIAGS